MKYAILFSLAATTLAAPAIPSTSFTPALPSLSADPLLVESFIAEFESLGSLKARQSVDEFSPLLLNVIDGVESITEVGTDEGGDHTDTAVHLVPGFPEGANLGGKNRRDESLPSLITRVVDDVENIVDGVGLTDTVDELGLGFKEKRQGDILTEVENLLAERENELTGTVDSALGLDGLFPVSSKRSDSIAELVDALESTPDSATSELGLGSLGLKEKRRDVFDFTDTVVVDAVGQIDKTIGAAPLLEGSLP